MNFVFDVSFEEYEEFVKTHKQKSHFLQSYAWGEISKIRGLTPHYVGVKSNNKLVATALLLQKHLPFGYSYFYSPRGFVMDFNNQELLEFITKGIKEFTKKKKGIFVKVDPDIKLHNLDIEGNVIDDGFNNYKLIEILKQLGYRHLGFNKNFEGTQPRYTFRLDLEKSLEEIRANMHSTTRKIINRDNPYGLQVKFGSKEDIKEFYELMKITSKRDDFISDSYEYYYNFFDILSGHKMSDFYYIKVNIKKMIDKTKNMLDEVLIKIKEIPEDNKKLKGKRNDLIDQQTKLEKNLKEYESYLKEYPEEVMITGILTVKYGNKVWTIHGGNHDIFRSLNANYILYYQILIDAKEQGYEVMDFFGTTGDSNPNNKVYGIHLFKKRFGGEYTEFIGEFDLVLRPILYYLFLITIPPARKLKRFIRKLIKNR